MNIDIKLHKSDLPDDLELGNVIAVDGEFMGLNVKRDPLCLIQISTGNSDAHIIQLDRSKYDAPNLIKILGNNNIKKIFHYGRADLAHIKYYLKTDTNNIEDTKIASKIVRTYTDSHGLKNLVQEFCNKSLDKRQGSSDWNKDINDLSDKQLEYAANDVIYLHKIKSELEKMLIREKRMEVFKKCLEFLDTRVELDQKGFKEDIFEH